MADQNIQVLLVEDNAEHAQLLERMLIESDEPVFEVLHFTALRPALDALDMVKTQVVLLDLWLPDSEGIETFLRMQNRVPDIPIVVLTGTDDEALAVKTVQRGAQDYLVKGRVDDRLLIRALRYALERKKTQFELKRARDDLERRVADRTEELTSANAKLQKEITERKRAEAALLESNRQLSEALEKLRETQEHIIQRERLHALGRMASGIAHDFNNALAPIIGFSELLLHRPETLRNEERARGYVEMIHTAAQDSAKIVGRLREFYRYREENDLFTPVSLNDLIQQVISLTQPRWKDQAQASGVYLTMKTELQNIPTIAGNESELREMLFNVVFNAIDAIQAQGTVTFRTSMREECALLEVVDNGAGMTEEVRLRCLEPFFSTKDQHGTGLGLGIVYGIVRRHDGGIEIESAPGKGTTVSITLPLYKEPEPRARPEPVSVMERPLSILVVEDEPLVREVIEVYLREDQHQVQTAVNGRQGLQKYREGVYDLVLTDRAMPEVNGDVLASEIKKINPRQPVILLTGFGDLMSGAGEKPEGVDLVVSKPFTLNSLREAMTKVMRLRNQPAQI
jgi:signal transduction histidine kinase